MIFSPTQRHVVPLPSARSYCSLQFGAHVSALNRSGGDVSCRPRLARPKAPTTGQLQDLESISCPRPPHPITTVLHLFYPPLSWSTSFLQFSIVLRKDLSRSSRFVSYGSRANLQSPQPRMTGSHHAEATPIMAEAPHGTDGAFDLMLRIGHKSKQTPAIFIHAGAGFHSHQNEHVHLDACVA